MFHIRKQRLRPFVLASLALTVPVAAVIAAEPGKVTEVIGAQTKTEAAARSSQAKVAKMDDDTGGMVSEYRQALAEFDSLKAYNEQLALQVNSQQEELNGLKDQLGEIDTTAREILPLLDRMLSTLDQFVKLDVPFLPEERARRIKALKDMMARADVSLSEKYRRIVEAYQIEMEYGRTLEAYSGKVNDKTVDFLRSGRVSLMFQTLDGKETGYWDSTAKKWVVDNSYSADVKGGLKVAKKQAAPNFVVAAVSAPKEAK